MRSIKTLTILCLLSLASLIQLLFFRNSSNVYPLVWATIILTAFEVFRFSFIKKI